jgi:hypothetical protein
MPTPTDYQRFYRFAQEFSQKHPLAAVAGDYYDLPGTIVYHSATHTLGDGGRIEVNTITPETPLTFAWEIEITINDKEGGRFIHLILQRDRSLAETYGKNLIPIDTARTDEILDILMELTKA